MTKRKKKPTETKVDRTMRRRTEAIERQIVKFFGDASDDLSDLAREFMDKFKSEERRMQVMLNWGQITDEEYNSFLMGTVLRSEWYEALARAACQYVDTAGERSAAFLNDNLPWFYAQEANYSAYIVEGVTRGAASLSLIDEQAVRFLALRRPDLLPHMKHNSARSDQWVQQRLRSEVASGIVRGESVDKMAKRFEQVTHMPRAASLTNARTAITGARNGGRQETIDRANVAGILVEKEWRATLDYRTRDSHQHLDGEVVGPDDRFSNGLLYPGDPNGRPEELYNCRCALRYRINGHTPEYRRDNTTGKVIDYMSYDEWREMKEAEDGES
jgi:SPP1 gp7 family putative phage head morphogenesis protein